MDADFWLKDRRLSDGSRPPLFGEADDWELNAITEKGLALHAYGFEIAARLLVEAAMTETAPIDAIVWPIAFCYRHYVELQLKEALRYSVELSDVSQEKFEEALYDHNLAKIWNIVRATIIDNDDRGSLKPDLGLLDKRIAELHSRDPRSTEFRYPGLRERDSQKPNLEDYHINIRQLRDAMDVLTQRLSALVDWLESLWQLQCDFREEYGAE